MSLDDSKVIKAKEIVDNPQAVDTITRPYIMVTDTAYSGKFDKLIDALEILAHANFEVVNFTGDTTTVLVMCKNLSFQRKNEKA